MKLIQMKCPNCKANLEISIDNKEYICNYCRTPIILDEEIIKVEHTITSSEITEKLKVANTHLYGFKDYDKAYNKFLELSEDYPYESEVWWGLILSLTENFNYNVVTNTTLNMLEEYIQKYMILEKDTKKKEINKQKYDKYIKQAEKTIELNENQIKGMLIIVLPILIILSVLIGAITYIYG